MRLEYQSEGSTSDVPQRVAVETEKYSILRNKRMGLLSWNTDVNPDGWNSTRREGHTHTHTSENRI